MPTIVRRRRQAAADESDTDHTPMQPQDEPARAPTPDSSAVGGPSRTSGSIELQTKNLVRLALASEHARQPLRRADINARCGTAPPTFRAVFEAAQRQLRGAFGMELVELPGRERVTVRERLAGQQATQAKGGTAPQKSWVLASALPAGMRRALAEAGVGVGLGPAGGGAEASYLGLYAFVVALISLSGGALSDAKLERHLRKVNAERSTPVDVTARLLERMRREGYIERKAESVGGELVTEYFVGPRGKVEVGDEGVAGLVRAVYGPLEEGEAAALDGRIERSLRIGAGSLVGADGAAVVASAGADGHGVGSGRGKRTRAAVREDSDGEED